MSTEWMIRVVRVSGEVIETVLPPARFVDAHRRFEDSVYTMRHRPSHIATVELLSRPILPWAVEKSATRAEAVSDAG